MIAAVARIPAEAGATGVAHPQLRLVVGGLGEGAVVIDMVTTEVTKNAALAISQQMEDFA